MASKQTRKSISITGDAYWALKARCEKDGTSMSGVCEGLIRTVLDMPNRDALAKCIPQKPAPKLKVTTKEPGVMVVTTKELAPKTDWREVSKPAPASRVETIRVAHEQIKVEPPPVLNEAQRAAAKIFTF